MRIFVISNIYGELDLFTQLLKKVSYVAQTYEFTLLGGYIDCGPDAKGSIEKVIDLQEDGAIILRGNHEDMLLINRPRGREVVRSLAP